MESPDPSADEAHMSSGQQEYTSAILNILTDIDEEKGQLRDTHRATLNLLDDFDANEKWLHASHRAVLNLLEDSEVDKGRLGTTQKALLNVLTDAEHDNNRLQMTQRALLNILEDVDAERDDRARAEAQVRELNSELENRVALRTAELTATNQELETFAYSVSHDLRTPLRAIDGFSRMLSDRYAGKLDTEGQRIIGVVRDGTRKMAQLINDILEFSRVGRAAMSDSAVDMNELVQDVIRELLPIIGERAVKIETCVLPPARGDKTMLRRVWLNLLENAVKYTSKHPTALINIGSQAGGTYYVKDDGDGFDMRYVDKLFGVFHRLHGPDEFSGTGIGLAIVKRVIARHSGRVWAEGVPNEGATFYFTLPSEERVDE